MKYKEKQRLRLSSFLITKNRVLTWVLCCFVAAFFPACDLFHGNNARKGVPISGAVEIGTEWVEIVPPEPLRSTALTQHVVLRMSDSLWRSIEWDSRDAKRQTLIFPGNKEGRLEAFLFDEQGDSYELHVGAIGGGIHLSRLLPSVPLDAPPRSEPDFPYDRKYIRLKIRSDVPIPLDGIDWISLIPK